jgi:hypothetical protein
LSLITLWSVRRLAASMERRLEGDSPVMQQLPAFARAAAASHELRLRRMGLLDRPSAELPRWRRWSLIVEGYAGKIAATLGRALVRPARAVGLVRARRLTDTYLTDPGLRAPRTEPPDPVDDQPPARA